MKKVRWKKLALDAAMVVTMPLWIIPALVVVVIGNWVVSFIEEYTE